MEARDGEGRGGRIRLVERESIARELCEISRALRVDVEEFRSDGESKGPVCKRPGSFEV